jgi:hypothetical protein
MPVDRDTRNELAESLGLLVNGKMTNNELDDRYYEKWRECEDETVREIAGFGYSLYSSGVGAYRLRGRNAVSQEVKEAAERASLFLRTDRDYPWPKRSPDALADMASLPWVNLGIPLLVVTLLFTGLGFFIKDYPWGFMLKLWAVVVAIVAAAMFGSRRRWQGYQEWCKAGDTDAWPFLQQADYEQARSEFANRGAN